jgi:hypothetical protein
MKKPSDLIQLIEDLQSEIHDSSVGTVRDSKAILHVGPDDEVGITLTADECRLLFHSEHTVRRLTETFNDPESMSVVLFNLDVTQCVQDLLERSFMSVDEM